MNIKPLNNRILVKPDDISVTEYGALVSSDNTEKPTTGVVVVGNNTAKEGDRVLFSKFGFDEVVIDREILYVVSDANIIGIFIN